MLEDRYSFAQRSNPSRLPVVTYVEILIYRRAGVKTGMALWQARQVCPEIIFVPPRNEAKTNRNFYRTFTKSHIE
ncbi:hypothetical protein DW049_09120 [Ruminococcus sp. AF41-9]|nr:hypothetical protein DW049_09120 [Ruminococcus sp. AF41-9]